MLLTSQTGDSTGSMIVVWGQSMDSYDDAIKSAVQYSAQQLPSGATAEWFEVIEMRGGIKNGNSAQFQVALRVGYSA